MFRQALVKLFDYNLRVVELNLEGVTFEESLVQPQGGGNCANWVLGHIVANRNPIMELIGENPVWSEEKAAIYRRGSLPLTDPAIAISLESMLSDLRASQEKLRRKLPQMTSEELEKPQGDGTTYERLTFLQFHEAYHAGQLGLLRRWLGKAGAIK